MIAKLDKSTEAYRKVIAHWYESVDSYSPTLVADIFPQKLEGYLLIEAEDATAARKILVIEGDSNFFKTQLNSVIRTLQSVLGNCETYCYYEYLNFEFSTQPKIPEDDFMCSCKLDEVRQVSIDQGYDVSPSMWCGADQSKFFLHDMDLNFAIFGGPLLVIEALRAGQKLTVQVPADCLLKDAAAQYGAAYLKLYGARPWKWKGR